MKKIKDLVETRKQVAAELIDLKRRVIELEREKETLTRAIINLCDRHECSCGNSKPSPVVVPPFLQHKEMKVDR